MHEAQTTQPEATEQKPQRFMVRFFSSASDCEDFLNLLGEDWRVAGYADTEAYVSVCVERVSTASAETLR